MPALAKLGEATERRGSGRSEAELENGEASSSTSRRSARLALQPGELHRRGTRSALFAWHRGEARRLHPGTFSFNAGNGRCPGCQGSGFEHVEMQFLSDDVYLRCPDCDGALSPGSARGELAGKSGCRWRTCWRRQAIVGAGRCASIPGRAPARAAGRRRARLPVPRPARSDALGRRGAAPQLAGHLAGGAGRQQSRRCGISLGEPRTVCFVFDSPPPACTSRTSPSCSAPSTSCCRPGIR